jgi:outer membrane scaffolding protein for murein synthesis (MipA/OmpV family)
MNPLTPFSYGSARLLQCRPDSKRCSTLAACWALLWGAALPARAEQPLWELGMGAGALRVPHYRGSDQSHDWLLPVPYLVYRGSFLKSDRKGTRAVLLDTDALDLNLSADASPPTASGANRARQGMPDLAATLELGPNLNVRLVQGPGWKVDLRLPLRAAFTLEARPQALGWTFSPVINLDMQARGWNLGMQAGPLAATRRFNSYFYDVPAPYATAARPAYRTGAGAAGWGATAAVSRRAGDFWVAAFGRYDSVAGASFDASPLVTQRSNLTYGLALSYIFKVSDQTVPDDAR